VQNAPVIYWYARVWTNGQSVAAQAAALRKHGGKVFREVASGAKTDRAQLRRVLDQLDQLDEPHLIRTDPAEGRSRAQKRGRGMADRRN
jgi:hypothetical protein